MSTELLDNRLFNTERSGRDEFQRLADSWIEQYERQPSVVAGKEKQLKLVHRPYQQIRDIAPIRATCFHPKGHAYIVGSNSKKLWICHYPTREELSQKREDEFSFEREDLIEEPEILYQMHHTHRGSIYCATFNQSGNLFATGSNDQTVHVVQYDAETNLAKGSEYKLTMHNGTVRDLCFMRSSSEPVWTGADGPTRLAGSSLSSQRGAYLARKSPLGSPASSTSGSKLASTSSGADQLISAGAGDCEIYHTDCSTMKSRQVFRGHHSTIMSVHHWGEANLFASGSLDGSIRLWDLRTRQASSLIVGGQARGVGVVRVESSGRLLVSGHQDGRCMFHDLRGGKLLQQMKLHDGEIRTLNFSPNSYYLLTGGYDGKLKLLDLQGDLTKKLPLVEIAELSDKVVQTAWHPSEYNFVVTSSDGSAGLWMIPPSAWPATGNDSDII